MIKIGNRYFIPLKVAAHHVGFSVDWVKNCSRRYNFPKRVYLSARRSGFWLDQLDSWLARRARQSAKTARAIKRAYNQEDRAA